MKDPLPEVHRIKEEMIKFWLHIQENPWELRNYSDYRYMVLRGIRALDEGKLL